jgi:hypothetical protein
MGAQAIQNELADFSTQGIGMRAAVDINSFLSWEEGLIRG